MARNVINRSISFDPEIFAKMEDRRSRLMMDRSEYVKRCIMKDMMAGGSMSLDEAPQSLVNAMVSLTSRLRPGGKKTPAKKK